MDTATNDGGDNGVKTKVTKRDAQRASKSTTKGAKGTKGGKKAATAKPSKNTSRKKRDIDSATGKVVRLSDQEIPLKRPHRFRPGTQTEREIKRYQKDGRQIMAQAPLIRLARELLANWMEDARLSDGAQKVLLQGCESLLTDLFTETGSLAQLCQVETIDAPHLQHAADTVLRRPRRPTPIIWKRSRAWHKAHPEGETTVAPVVKPSKSRAKPFEATKSGEPDATDESTVGH